MSVTGDASPPLSAPFVPLRLREVDSYRRDTRGAEPDWAIAARRAGRYSAPMPVLMTGHVQLDERGVAWIDDTNTKVIEVALDMIAHGWSSEDFANQVVYLPL